MIFPSDNFGHIISAESQNQELINLDLGNLPDLIKQKKVILLRGFDSDIDAFKAFTEKWGKGFLAYQGGAYVREKINNDSTVLSVTGGTNQKTFIPLHGEMHYKKMKPKLLWFYCITPPVKKGETTVCDGKALFEALKPDTQQFFQNHQIQYIRTYTKEQWQQIFKVHEIGEAQDFFAANQLQTTLSADESLVTKYRCHATCKDKEDNMMLINNILPVSMQELMGRKGSIVRLENGEKIPKAILWELWRRSNECLVKIPWQKGDILLIDNMRAMHGRAKIKDNQRNIAVRMSDTNFEIV